MYELKYIILLKPCSIIMYSVGSDPVGLPFKRVAQNGRFFLSDRKYFGLDEYSGQYMMQKVHCGHYSAFLNFSPKIKQPSFLHFIRGGEGNSCVNNKLHSGEIYARSEVFSVSFSFPPLIKSSSQPLCLIQRVPDCQVLAI